MKVVINACFGGFGLSKTAKQWLRDRGMTEDEVYDLRWEDSERANPLLVECVETLGRKADGDCAELVVVEIPDDVEWEIDEYDGRESVEEKHRSWC